MGALCSDTGGIFYKHTLKVNIYAILIWNIEYLFIYLYAEISPIV